MSLLTLSVYKSKINKYFLVIIREMEQYFHIEKDFNANMSLVLLPWQRNQSFSSCSNAHTIPLKSMNYTYM